MQRYRLHTLRFIFLTNLKYFDRFRHISVFEMTAIIGTSKFTVFSSGFFCQIYRVPDEALIAETMVWSNFFLINVFFALKGSKLLLLFLENFNREILLFWICTRFWPLAPPPVQTLKSDVMEWKLTLLGFSCPSMNAFW